MFIIKKSSGHTLQGWTPHHLPWRQAQHSATACGVNYSGHRAAEHQDDRICGSLYRVLWWRQFFYDPPRRGRWTEHRFRGARRTAQRHLSGTPVFAGNHLIETDESSVKLSSFRFSWLRSPKVVASVRISALWWLLQHLADLSSVRPGHSRCNFYKQYAAVQTRHRAVPGAQQSRWLLSVGLQELGLIKIPRNHSLAKGYI